jgi:hypothetical protein
MVEVVYYEPPPTQMMGAAWLVARFSKTVLVDWPAPGIDGAEGS